MKIISIATSKKKGTRFPEANIVVYPECSQEVVTLADARMALDRTLATTGKPSSSWNRESHNG